MSRPAPPRVNRGRRAYRSSYGSVGISVKRWLLRVASYAFDSAATLGASQLGYTLDRPAEAFPAFAASLQAKDLIREAEAFANGSG